MAVRRSWTRTLLPFSPPRPRGSSVLPVPLHITPPLHYVLTLIPPKYPQFPPPRALRATPSRPPPSTPLPGAVRAPPLGMLVRAGDRGQCRGRGQDLGDNPPWTYPAGMTRALARSPPQRGPGDRSTRARPESKLASIPPPLLVRSPTTPWASRRANSRQSSLQISRNTPTVRVSHPAARAARTHDQPPVDKRELQQWYVTRAPISMRPPMSHRRAPFSPARPLCRCAQV